jgi:hypothetical protein
MEGETTMQRRVRERREFKAATREAELRAEASRLALEQLDREEREQALAAQWGQFAGIGLEDITADDSGWDEEELNQRYFVNAVNGILDEMRGLKEGTRNNTLNECAFKVGQLSAGLNMPAVEALIALRVVAMKTGLTKQATVSTLKSGFNAGVKHPRGRS